jgi:hypothetical protein
VDDNRAAMLGEIATEAGLERSSFVADAAQQLDRFLHANRDRLREIGGLVLIDEDPDYLSVAPDGTFRSRTRYQDESSGEWVSETEVIESPAELVELYNPADVFAAFTDAARQEAGLGELPTGAEDLEGPGVVDEDIEVLPGTEGVAIAVTGPDVYAQAADDWAAGAGDTAEPTDTADAARLLYDLALTYQERSQQTEAHLLELFEEDARALAEMLGDQMILDDADERLWFRSDGTFEAEVVPERDEEAAEDTRWQPLRSADEMVQFYDPTDLFGDLAEAIADQYPEVAPARDEEDDSAT